MDDGLTERAEALLDSEPLIGHLATCRDGRPHAAPLWYAVHEGHLELSTTGRKLANLRTNPKVALSVEKSTDGEPVWGVSVQGTARVVEDASRGDAIIRRVNRRYGEAEDAWGENTAVVIEVDASSAWAY
ncbi:MAG: pyridoxamine 5'-phosphate oxidase family protein [Halobacteriales archaeon]|nr:pyridoxamine 5'-phosphate oxidase family protein [Halobacteriales archaeon]